MSRSRPLIAVCSLYPYRGSSACWGQLLHYKVSPRIKRRSHHANSIIRSPPTACPAAFRATLTNTSNKPVLHSVRPVRLFKDSLVLRLIFLYFTLKHITYSASQPPMSGWEERRRQETREVQVEGGAIHLKVLI